MSFQENNSYLRSEKKSHGISFLEKNFSKLSKEGQSHLKNYLQSLVSLQKTMTGFRKECTEMSSN